MYTTLEDEFGDIIGKARQGQQLDAEELSRQAGLPVEQILRIERYESIPAPAVIDRLARCLGLHPQKLQGVADKAYFPRYPAGLQLEGLVVEMMVLGTDCQVNGYLVGCSETGKGMVIDPGMEAEKILQQIEATGLQIEQILLTHGHPDHVGALSEVCQATAAPALIGDPDLEALGGLQTRIEGSLVNGQRLTLGHQTFSVLSLPGHTPGASCLLHQQLAFVGDVLFAGSLGRTRTRINYQGQRQAVSRDILSLNEQVVLYPGHGPATTVGEERHHNPFFP